jgi:hypothetical protein
LDDLEVVNVKVGATNRSSKGVARAEEGDGVYNHLGDLIEDYALIILKVGRLGYKNRAASGAIQEFLLIRESQRKPTWVVIDGDHYWDRMDPETQDYGYSYSTAVEAHLDRWFEEIEITSADPGEGFKARMDNHIIVEDDVTVPSKPARKPVKAEFHAELPAFRGVTASDIDSMLGGGESKSKKWRKR